MKTDTSIQSLMFNPELSLVGNWPTVRQAEPRRRARSLATETQIDNKGEFICGVILILSLLFGLSAVVAQFALA